MPRELSWRKTLGAKLTGITLALLAVALLLIFGNLSMLSSIQADSAQMNLYARGRFLSYEMIYLANRYFDEEPDKGRAQELQTRLNALIKQMDERYELLTKGDPEHNIPPLSHPQVLS